MKADPDAMLLTRGQWLVDAIVQAGIHKPTSGRLTEESNVGNLRRYIYGMGGVRTPLIFRLLLAQDRAMADPASLYHLKVFARARQALEAHIEQLEIAHGKRYGMKGGTLSVRACRRRERNKRNRKTKGWSVCRSSQGRNSWRLSLTSMVDGRPRQVGTFKSRAAAEREGIRIIAELRGTAKRVG